MIIVLFGQPCSGKSTLANKLIEKVKLSHSIDGDVLREIFSNKDYSKEGRIRNLNRASDIAVYLDSVVSKQRPDSLVILSLVYPYKEARDYLNSLSSNVKWIYLTYDEERGRENYHVKDFDIPTESSILQLNTSEHTEETCLDIISKYIGINS